MTGGTGGNGGRSAPPTRPSHQDATHPGSGPEVDGYLPKMTEQKRSSDPATAPGTTDANTESHDEIAETDDSKLPHPPATATEEADEGVASQTDDGPEMGTSPGAG